MCEENTSQKERFLQEIEQKLLHRELDARLLEDGLIRIKWNGQPLCSVDRDGIVRFRPADITGPEVDRQLRTVISRANACVGIKIPMKLRLKTEATPVSSKSKKLLVSASRSPGS